MTYALNTAIKAAQDAAKEGVALKQFGVHTVDLNAPCGAAVQIGAQFTSGNIASSIRVTYKVNGKRAKAADVAELFRESAPVIATRDFRKNLGELVGM